MRSFKIALIALVLLTALPAMALADTFTAYGTVTDANQYPVPDATVTLADGSLNKVATTSTDMNGNFVFYNVTTDSQIFKVLVSYTSGNTTYTIPEPKISYYPASGIRQIDPNQTRLLDYPPAGKAAHEFGAYGRVTDAEGRPIPMALVTLVDLYYNPIISARTGTDGSFNFANLTTNSYTFKVLVSFTQGGREYALPASWLPWYSCSGVQQINENQTELYDYPPADKGFIYGYIVKDDGKTPLDGTVYLSNGMTSNVTDPLQYSFNVPVGNYTLYATHDENGKHYVSDTIHVSVVGTRYITSVNPTVIKVKPDHANPTALAAALALGALGIAGGYLLLRRMD